MSNLTFQNTTLVVVPHNNQTYITSTDLACALGYSDTRSITNIYNRNQDEFSADMTDVINLMTSGNLQTTVRIFSLRGAHLIAMFSRTKVAKEFRKWVLDILDKEIKQSQLALPEPEPTINIELTESELKKLISVWLQFTRFEQSVSILINNLGLSQDSYGFHERSLVFNRNLCKQNIKETYTLMKQLGALIAPEMKCLISR